jgi:hypothetical protein
MRQEYANPPITTRIPAVRAIRAGMAELNRKHRRMMAGIAGSKYLIGRWP